MGPTHLCGVAAELLAQGERRGVLRVRPPYLDDAGELLRLLVQLCLRGRASSGTLISIRMQRLCFAEV